MAYSVPPANAVDFSVIRRPARPHLLPGLTGVMLMNGPLIPPGAPRLRRRAMAAWVPAGELDTVGNQHMTGMAICDARRGERLQLASPQFRDGSLGWSAARRADLRQVEQLHLATVIAQLKNDPLRAVVLSGAGSSFSAGVRSLSGFSTMLRSLGSIEVR